MELMPTPLTFEWDTGNQDKNLRKHNVTCQETEEVFGNEPLIVSGDIKHSDKEERYFALGITNDSRRLYVIFTIRNTRIRIISVRDMNKKEKRIYEKA